MHANYTNTAEEMSAIGSVSPCFEYKETVLIMTT
jgi:hypothetical protein